MSLAFLYSPIHTFSPAAQRERESDYCCYDVVRAKRARLVAPMGNIPLFALFFFVISALLRIIQ